VKSGLDKLMVMSLVASLALNMWFIVHERQRTPEALMVPKVGSRLPPLKVLSLNGTAAVLSYGGANRPRLVYLFSPTCGWCDKNWDNMHRLAAGVRSSHDVVLISIKTDGLDKYIAAHNLAQIGDIYREPSIDSRLAYGFGTTPQTLVISAEGTVVDHWRGAYGERLKVAIEKQFGVTLPGIKNLL
jgi:hypothetical protein